MHSQTFQSVQRILSEKCSIDLDSITADSRLVEDLCLDSLDVIDLTMCVEEQLEIAIDDTALDSLVTFGDFVAVVERIVAATEGGEASAAQSEAHGGA